MRPRRFATPVLLSAAAACYGPPETPVAEPLGHPEAAAILVQAVDAGTGAALSDAEMTVRYLVRSPITLDASSVVQVTSLEPYEIRHVIQEDTLVLEMRLEATSYHRLDTVLAVPKGTTAGPLTMRLSRRPDAKAAAA